MHCYIKDYIDTKNMYIENAIVTQYKFTETLHFLTDYRKQ